MNTMKKHLVLSFLMSVIFTVSAVGQDNGTNPAASSVGSEQHPAVKIPSLRGHKFLPSSIVGSPFIATHMKNSLGYGATVDLELPIIVINGEEILSLKGDLIFLALDFEYQQAVKDWLGFWLDMSITGRLGSGVEALLSQGVTTAINTEMGWILKLYRSEEFMLSGTVGIRNHSITVIDIRGFVEKIIEDGGIEPGNTLVRSVPITRAGLGLRAGYAASDLVGFTAVFDNGISESMYRGESAMWYFSLGATVDIDLAMCSSVPIGFALAYNYSNAPDGIETESQGVNAASFIINYTGTTDFLVGLETTSRWTPMIDFDRTLNYFTAMINMRYYF